VRHRRGRSSGSDETVASLTIESIESPLVLMNVAIAFRTRCGNRPRRSVFGFGATKRPEHVVKGRDWSI
jgi:hypothetical protein